jgi:type I restriction enzyme S subunit
VTWNKVKFGEVIIENPKSKIKVRDSFNDGKFKFFTSGEKINYVDNYLCDGENIFIATGGKANFSFFSGKASYSTDCYSVTTKKQVNTKFLYYFLVMVSDKINKTMFEGAALKHLQKTKFKNIDFKYPPLAEQQRIVAKLDAVFAEIDKSNRLVESKITQLKKLKKLALPQILKESNSRNVTLGEICEIIGGGTPSKNNPKYFDGNIPWATVRDMKSDNIETTEFSITKEGLMNSSTKVIEKGNIVIATRVGLGKVCVLKKDTAINQDLKGIIPKIKELDTNYLFYCLKNMTEKIIAAGRGATVQGVKLPFIKSLSLLLPSIKEQKIITAKLIEVFEIIEVASNSLLKSQKNYVALKSAILKQEMYGNLE